LGTKNANSGFFGLVGIRKFFSGISEVDSKRKFYNKYHKIIIFVIWSVTLQYYIKGPTTLFGHALFWEILGGISADYTLGK
jgi:hypothetical protein